MRAWIAVLCLLPLLAACSQDHRTDLQKLTDFHKQVAAVDRHIDDATSTYSRASKAALKTDNHAALYAAASAFRLAVVAIGPQVQALGVPDFKNKSVGTFAGQALAALQGKLDAWQNAATALKSMTDPAHPVPAAAAAVAQAQNDASSNAIAEDSAIIQAYGDLGITPDRVDTRHGGLKPAPKPGKPAAEKAGANAQKGI